MTTLLQASGVPIDHYSYEAMELKLPACLFISTLVGTSYSVFAVIVFDAIAERLRGWSKRFTRSAA